MDAYQRISVIFFGLLFSLPRILSKNYSYIDLPESQLSYYFNNFPNVAEKCKTDENCVYRDWLIEHPDIPRYCWGYEDQCQREYAFSQPKCTGKHPGMSPESQVDSFYVQADFGM